MPQDPGRRNRASRSCVPSSIAPVNTVAAVCAPAYGLAVGIRRALSDAVGPLTDTCFVTAYTLHMFRVHLRSSIFAVSCLLGLPAAGAATLPAGFSETRVATGLADPTAMAIAP